MEKEALFLFLSESPEGQMVKKLTALIDGEGVDVDVLFGFSSSSRKEVAFRAAWMLEYIYTNNPDKFSGYVNVLISLLPEQKNPSVMRHFAKIISMMTSNKAVLKIKAQLDKQDLNPLIDVLFSWLIDEDVLVATKVHCMQSLANLSDRYDWIKPELLETIDHFTEIESIAFFARAKQIKKQLAKKPAGKRKE